MNNVLDNIQDFIVSIGMEALKKNGEVLYNEKKIKNELIEYVGREMEIFEDIDRIYEIDFDSLKIYFIERFIEDFRQSLYGDIKRREQKSASIIDYLCSYVHADSPAKREYVQRVLEGAFKIIKNYYEIHIVQSENLYLANKIVDEIHQDIVQSMEHKDEILKRNSSKQNAGCNISMNQYGERNQQIGQVTRLTINN